MWRTLTVVVSLLALVLQTGGGVAAQEGGQIPGGAPQGEQAVLGTAFTYQGQLRSGGSPYTGACDLRFGLWDAGSGGAQIGAALTKSNVGVAAGYFTVQLDFGAAAFQGAARWLAIEVRCPAGAGSYTALDPRQPLTAAPYALYAAAAPWAGLAGVPADLADGDQNTLYTAGAGLTLNNGQFGVNFAGSGAATTVSRADHNHTGAYWSLAGNAGTTPGVNYLGTSDNTALELKVNGQRVLRLEPASSPNLLGGYSGNLLTAGVTGATVGGGGSSGNPNRVTDSWGTVGGGINNRAGDDAGTTEDARFATVGGGNGNAAQREAATIGGGAYNSVLGASGVVAGGDHNHANAANSTIAGGGWNEVTGAGANASIGGGYENTAGGAYATIGGGGYNTASGNGSTIAGGGGYIDTGFELKVFTNTVTSALGTIGGGGLNFVTGIASTVGGGTYNTTNGQNATVGGGGSNTAGGFATVGGGGRNTASGYESTVAGGWENVASASEAAVGGGGFNIATDEFCTVAGGLGNQAGDRAGAQDDRQFATVGGGTSNTASGANATVAGGFMNTASGTSATVGGGRLNTAGGTRAIVAGGYNNTASTDYAAVGGGESNTAGGGSATVAGGADNNATALETAVGGGISNLATDERGTVAGGYNNQAGDNAGAANDRPFAAVGGGRDNIASGTASVVAGGDTNIASGWRSMVPGGVGNTAAGEHSFAAGRRAKANNNGCFVWGDAVNVDVACNDDNRWVARASGGVYFYSNSGLTAGVYVAAGGNSWNGVSDRATKENFRPVNGQALLDTLAGIPVREYSLKSQDASIRHIGPVAQDFAALGYGESATAINMQDADGVALAAIQALYTLNRELQAENAALQARIAALDARLTALEQAARDAGTR
jgi:hypothetical protein